MRRLLAALLLGPALLAPGLAWAAMPTPAEVRSSWRPSEARLLDRHGVPLESVRVELQARRGSWVVLADISPALGAAVLQAEDQRFMEHGGIDLRAAGQAAWDNLLRGRPRGASTITMQLAGLLDLELRAAKEGRSWRQKFDQVLGARELEAGWSKAQILEAYLNLVTFRGELQGVGAAARALFGKAPSGLDVAESAILAALLRAPSAHPKQVARRACQLAAELKTATTCQAIEWRAAVALARQGGLAKPNVPQAWRALLGKGGANVRTTLDAGIQHAARDALRRHVRELADRNVGDGAVVVIDNASGELLAWVANLGTSEVDGVLAPRQAGSTLKPFLYGLAIERRLFTAASLLEDSPLDVAVGSGSYVPRNYDRSYKGQASLRTSLASSLNVPAVRTLLTVGGERFHARLQALGLSTLTEDADFYGPSLALGSADVTLLELANAYRTLANGGRFSRVALRPGPARSAVRVLDPAASWVIGDILSDRGARSPTFGLRNDLATAYWSAAKTGTSKDMRDNWCVGYSDRYTVGVWVGNFNGQPMWDVSGVSGAAPVWRDVMDFLHRDRPGRQAAGPGGLVKRRVSYLPEVEPPREEWFLAGTETSVVEAVPPARRAPKIVYPPDGSILAIDPDIPDSVERVILQAEGVQGHRWRLDGSELGTAAKPFSWQPTPGGHRLELVDAGGNAVSTSSFEVRGNQRD